MLPSPISKERREGQVEYEGPLPQLRGKVRNRHYRKPPVASDGRFRVIAAWSPAIRRGTAAPGQQQAVGISICLLRSGRWCIVCLLALHFPFEFPHDRCVPCLRFTTEVAHEANLDTRYRRFFRSFRRFCTRLTISSTVKRESRSHECDGHGSPPANDVAGLVHGGSPL